MQKKPGGLGRGLDALFAPATTNNNVNVISDKYSVAEEDKPQDNDVLKNLKITEIEPNRNQPRKNFNQESLEELAQSIEEFGLIQPIVVSQKDGYYSIVAGERRWRACKIAGLTEIPVLVREDDDEKNSQISLIENIQREDLNPYEKAIGIRRLLDNYGYTQDQLSKKLGKHRSTIANQVRVLNLAPKVLELVKEGKLTEGHCKALLAIHDPEKQYVTAVHMIERKATVRQVEKTVELKATPEQEQRNQILYKKIEDTFQGFFGSKVKLNPGKRRGKIVIEYSSNDDLERLLGLLDR